MLETRIELGLDTRMSDEALLAALGEALQNENEQRTRVIVGLIEVEKRGLHLNLAFSSMFDFCLRRLEMSEGEAFLRLTAARLAALFPPVLDAIRARRVHLSNLVLLRDLFTEENVCGLLDEAAGKSKRSVQELVAQRAPKPDAASSIRKSTVRKGRAAPSTPVSPLAATPLSAAFSSSATSPLSACNRSDNGGAVAPTSISPDLLEVSPVVPISHPSIAPPKGASFIPSSSSSSTSASFLSSTEPLAQMTPLSEGRHRVQFTASTELREMLERGQSLMRHNNIRGELAVVVHRAMKLLIAQLEKEKLAATTRPRRRKTSDATMSDTTQSNTTTSAAKSKSVPAAVRREVIARDGEQCVFVSASGDRCQARELLELDHLLPRALGGGNDVANLRLLCRSHNQHAAERIFGREHMRRAIRKSQEKQHSRQAKLPRQS